MKGKNNRITRKNPPLPANTNKKPSVLSTLGESMIWGTGMGFGSEAGHSVFRGIFGGNNNNQVHKNDTCLEITKLYEKCLVSNSFEQHKCDFLKEDINKFCNI